MPRFVFLFIFPVLVVAPDHHHEVNLNNGEENKEEGHGCKNNVAHLLAALIHRAISELFELSSLIHIITGLIPWSPKFFIVNSVKRYVDSEKILDGF